MLDFDTSVYGANLNCFVVSQVEVSSGRGKPPVVVDKDESLAKVIRSISVDFDCGRFIKELCSVSMKVIEHTQEHPHLAVSITTINTISFPLQI